VNVLTLLVAWLLWLSPNAPTQSFTQPGTDENFRLFFDAFNQDAEFQLTRIAFPVLRKTEPGRNETWIQRSDWPYLNLFAEPRQAGRTLQVQRLGRRTYRVTQTKASGSRVHYDFRKEDGKWWLQQIIEVSLLAEK